MDASNAQIKGLQDNLLKLESQISFNDFLKNAEGMAYLTPGEGYSPVKFDLGYLTVQLADVKPYANGSKVTLRFGNVLSASINGLKTNIDWGKVDAKGMPLNETIKSKNS